MSDSPVKKLDFQSLGKENAPASFKPVDATTTKPAEGTDASASASEEDKKKKKKPGLTDEEIEQIRALSNPYS